MGTSPGSHLPVRLDGRGRETVATLYISPTAEDGAVSGLMLHFIDTTGAEKSRAAVRPKPKNAGDGAIGRRHRP